MRVTLKDGSVKEYDSKKSIIDIAKDISEGLARSVVAGEVNGVMHDLRDEIDSDCELNLITLKDEKGLSVIRHTTSHVLAQAVKRVFPQSKLAIGPSIAEGFYYDFEHEPFSRDDLDKLEAEMKKIIKEGEAIERFELPREEAIKFMEEKNEPYKVELIKDLPEGEKISFYKQGDFTDLCAGPHLQRTKDIKAFKLVSSSMAYWRGDSNKARLQRIYGTAYNSKEELEAYLKHLEDIKLRDHNKLGREMELFTTVDVVGQGLPLMLPKGTKMIQKLQRWIEDLEDNEWGYVRTRTPLMAKSALYKILMSKNYGMEIKNFSFKNPNGKELKFNAVADASGLGAESKTLHDDVAIQTALKAVKFDGEIKVQAASITEFLSAYKGLMADSDFNQMMDGIKPFEERVNSLFAKDGEYMSAKFKHDVGSDDLLVNDKISLKEFIMSLMAN